MPPRNLIPKRHFVLERVYETDINKLFSGIRYQAYLQKNYLQRNQSAKVCLPSDCSGLPQ